jgi:FkbM family methyltransferase
MKEANVNEIYSEFGQDLLVLELLGWKRNGFFLDSGASDGVISNNTHLLEVSYNWNGICVEPNEVFFEKLVKNRKCHCMNYCLYDKEDYIDFLELGNDVGGIMVEYHPSHLDRAKASYNVKKDLYGNPKTVKKLTRTIEQVLKECNAPQTIDYWSLDTEGSELTILKSFPFDEYSFRVITVEHNHFPVREEIREFLEFKGYYRIKELGVDDCYVQM